MTAIKICGITRHEDADAAVNLGVHALGFVLWAGSPRSVSLDQMAQVVSRVCRKFRPGPGHHERQLLHTGK